MTIEPLRPDPAKIIVPRKHAQILIEPPLTILAAALGTSSPSPPSPTARADGRSFANQPLEPLRTAARRHFLAAAAQWARETDAPPPPKDACEKSWVLTGHQVEFYHAGVWAKVIVADALAKKAGGVAFDILVDHDVVDHLGFDVPTEKDNLWHRTPVHFAEAPDLPADSLAAPTAGEFAAWHKALESCPQAHTDSLARILANLAPSPARSAPAASYVSWLSRARADFERTLGLDVHHVPTSLLCQSEIWEFFVQAWIDNADAWTRSYNAHLAAYRKRQGIKNPQHPMPDLVRSTAGDVTTYELPFWSYGPGQPRQRFVIRKSPGQKIEFKLRNSESQIRPRALTLTMYLRLFLADLFIHGIGGALYDQITDGMLEELFHAAPPYACVSAAWLLPLGRPLENVDDIPRLQSRRHHLLHNPQLAIAASTAAGNPQCAVLLEIRQTLLEKITASLAGGRHVKAAMETRRSDFRALHAVNHKLHELAPEILAALDQQIDAARRAREQNKVLLWREYFFGLHSIASLQQLIVRFRA